jgi:hypothetical protein
LRRGWNEFVVGGGSKEADLIGLLLGCDCTGGFLRGQWCIFLELFEFVYANENVIFQIPLRWGGEELKNLADLPRPYIFAILSRNR